jgi:hypothetical protein
VLLKLPHRQFVFTVPKALRVFFRNNRKLFADISRLIFSIIKEFYKEATGKDIQTGMIIAHQTFRRHAPEGWKAAQQCLPLDGGGLLKLPGRCSNFGISPCPISWLYGMRR